MEGLIGMLINLLILALVLGLVWWVIGMIPLPGPFDKIVRVVFAVIVVLIMISVLLGYLPPVPLYGRRP